MVGNGGTHGDGAEKQGTRSLFGDSAKTGDYHKKKKNPETEVTLIYSKEAKKSKTKEEIRFTGEVGRVKFISLQFA